MGPDTAESHVMAPLQKAPMTVVLPRVGKKNSGGRGGGGGGGCDVGLVCPMPACKGTWNDTWTSLLVHDFT